MVDSGTNPEAKAMAEINNHSNSFGDESFLVTACWLIAKLLIPKT